MYVICLKEKFTHTMDTQGEYHVNMKTEIYKLRNIKDCQLTIRRQEMWYKFPDSPLKEPTMLTP